MATIQIPVLFDMSGDTLVFGEEVSGDFVSSHLDFLLDMTTEANDISLNAADISSAILVGDQDTGDNIFYSGGSSGNIAVDNLCNRIAKAITRGKLVHVPKTGNSSNSGIPMGGRLYVVRADGQQELPPDGQYAEKYPHSIAPIGDEQMLGEAMARVTSVHLMGTPLPASILVNKNSVQNDLETASGQTFNSGNTAFYNALAVQLSKVLGGSKSSAPMNNGSGGSSSGGGSGPDLASQIYYEDFEDQAYGGTSTTAEVVSGGYNSSSYALATPGTGANSKRWQLSPAIVGGNINNMRVISLWYYADFSSGGTNGHTILDFRPTAGGTQGVAISHENRPANAAYEKFQISGDKIEKLYINGSQITYSGSYITSPLTYSSDQWIHILVEIKSNHGLNASILLNSGHVHDGRYHCGGKIDEVRIFNAPLSTSQIADLAAGNNGSGGTVDPYDVASSNSTLSGQTYTSSSSLADWPAEKAFDTLPVDMTPDLGTPKVAWISADNKYSNSNYSGSETTDGYSGEWVQVDIGQSIVLKEYKLLPRPWADDIHPAAMRLFSSTDGTNWTQIQDWTGLTLANWKDGAAGNTGTYKTLGPYTTNTTGRYFRLVVNKLITGNYNLAQIGEIELKGLLPSQDSGGSSSGSSSGYPLDASGTSVPALKSIYEQLMNVPGRSQIMETRDVSGVRDNSNVTLAGGFPFIAGDKLVMYLRPKIVFAAQTQAENNNALFAFNYTGSTILGTPAYNIADKNGPITGQTYSQSSSQNNTMFIFEKATTGAGVAGDIGYWTSAGSTYNNTTGVHEGANANGSTTNVDGANTIAGEWGQVDVGESSWATELQLTTNNSYNDRSPREFRLLGSTDGTNWKTLIHQTEAGPWVDSTPQTFTISNPTSYRYYRYVVIKCYNAVNAGNIDSRTSIGHFNLRGVKYPSEVVEVTNAGLMNGSPLDISGLQTNVVASSANISDAFPGNATSGPEAEASKWGWMGSANSDSLSLDTTDVTDPRTIDLHIWKITITL